MIQIEYEASTTWSDGGIQLFFRPASPPLHNPKKQRPDGGIQLFFHCIVADLFLKWKTSFAASGMEAGM